MSEIAGHSVEEDEEDLGGEDWNSPFYKMALWDVVELHISANGCDNEIVKALRAKLRWMQLDKALTVISECYVMQYLLGTYKNIPHSNNLNQDMMVDDAAGVINALNELWEYEEGKRPNYLEEVGTERKRMRMVEARFGYISREIPDMRPWFEMYGMDDVPSWRAERIENFQSGNIDCLPGWLRFISVYHRLLVLSDEGGRSTMTAAKKENTKQAILESRKKKLLDRANKQISILEQYQETGKYDKRAMNNNWLKFDGNKIMVIPRIGGYPVSRAIKGGVVHEGGVGWECDGVEEAMTKIQGFILNLRSNIFDIDILRMFDPISMQQRRIAKDSPG